jgi:hypothetical protein
MPTCEYPCQGSTQRFMLKLPDKNSWHPANCEHPCQGSTERFMFMLPDKDSWHPPNCEHPCQGSTQRFMLKCSCYLTETPGILPTVYILVRVQLKGSCSNAHVTRQKLLASSQLCTSLSVFNSNVWRLLPYNKILMTAGLHLQPDPDPGVPPHYCDPGRKIGRRFMQRWARSREPLLRMRGAPAR